MTKDASYFEQFKLVLVSNRSYADQVRCPSLSLRSSRSAQRRLNARRGARGPGQMKINDLCRTAGAMFVSCDVYGLCGYVFADLLDDYTYTECASTPASRLCLEGARLTHARVAAGSQRARARQRRRRNGRSSAAQCVRVAPQRSQRRVGPHPRGSAQNAAALRYDCG